MKVSRRKVSLHATLLVLPLVAACLKVERHAGFDDVRGLVSSRTAARIAWTEGRHDDSVDEHVGALLERELTPESAVQIALMNSPSLLATYERLGVAQADLVQAGLLPNPVLHASMRFGISGPGPGAELSLIQDFLRALQIPLRKRVAAAEFETAKLEVAQAVIDLVSRVKTTFYTLQGAEQMLELRATAAEATQLSADLAGRQHEAGNITDLDLASERALAAGMRLELSSAEGDVLTEREHLNALLGLWGRSTSWTVAGRLPAPPGEAIDRAALESLAISQRLDLAAARQSAEALTRSLGLARATAIFTTAAFGGEAEREPDGEWAAGPAIEFSTPIFDQGQAAVGKASAQLRESQRRYAALAVEIRADVRRASSRAEAARRRAEYYADVALPLRHEIVRRTQLQYNAMQLGVFELLQAKRDEIDAGRDYVETLTDYWLARTELERAVGGELPSGPTRPSTAPVPSPDAPAHRHHDHDGGH